MNKLDILQPKDFIGLDLQITIKDQRVLNGVLLALDNKPNLLIANTSETSKQKRFNSKTFETVTRSLGLVSVPFNTIESIKVKTTEINKTADWASQII